MVARAWEFFGVSAPKQQNDDRTRRLDGHTHTHTHTHTNCKTTREGQNNAVGSPSPRAPRPGKLLAPHASPITGHLFAAAAALRLLAARAHPRPPVSAEIPPRCPRPGGDPTQWISPTKKEVAWIRLVQTALPPGPL